MQPGWQGAAGWQQAVALGAAGQRGPGRAQASRQADLPAASCAAEPPDLLSRPSLGKYDPAQHKIKQYSPQAEIAPVFYRACAAETSKAGPQEAAWVMRTSAFHIPPNPPSPPPPLATPSSASAQPQVQERGLEGGALCPLEEGGLAEQRGLEGSGTTSSWCESLRSCQHLSCPPH